MDFFPSESASIKPSAAIPRPAAGAPRASGPAADAHAPARVAKDDSRPGDVTRLDLNVTQAMKEVQGLGVALGQLRAMAGELDERYRTLLQTCSTADQRRQDIESAFARIDSLAEMRLGQLSAAGELAARTEKMLARVEGLSADADRQLAAIADVKSIVSRDLARARAEVKSRAIVTGGRPDVLYRFNPSFVRFGAAMTAIHNAALRPSRAALVYAALAVFSVMAIGATWPNRNAQGMGMPVVESRVLSGSGFQPPQLPDSLEVEATSSAPRVANTGRATGFVGQLAIRSSPRGATVFIDGKPAGETPMPSVRVPAGSHAIWIELPRYHRWTTAVQVRAGGLTTVNATLRAAPDGQQAR